ncbi:DAZ-associated protein 2 [Drosophila grimshawi]|uniref:DAZ-associated protein 2 n=1 Tax=Drosophila grimshawi TaxID=7222 RepID=UPI000C87013B|nr:DAZ-associated protein 2 [Drosophila grimshawi]
MSPYKSRIYFSKHKEMSRPNSEKTAGAPSAGAVPPYSFEYDSAASMRAPPPSYEQSQQHRTNYAPCPPGPGCMPMHVPSNQYYGMTHHQQLPTLHPGLGYGFPGPSTSAGATAASHVINVDSRAELRTTSTGAVVIPPPPPGCLPTAAQLAAMQGQPVVVQQKKRSFFSS